MYTGIVYRLRSGALRVEGRWKVIHSSDEKRKNFLSIAILLSRLRSSNLFSNVYRALFM
jgi:hypothetical protein